MPRLRTTTTLSLLALLIGTAGTAWLSGMNVGWAGPSERVAGYLSAAPATRRPVRREAPRVVASHHRWLPAVAQAAPDEAPPPPPELRPVAMPSLPLAWSQAKGHLHGEVLVHLVIDGSGQVSAATLAASSGDPALDTRALDTVRRWRFAVPAGHPDGLSGDLPMRFTGE